MASSASLRALSTMQRLQSIAAIAVRVASKRTAAVPVFAAPHRRPIAPASPSTFLPSPVRHSSSPATATATATASAPFQLSATGAHVETWILRENSGAGKYQQIATARKHTITLDEPADYPGGTDAGPSPFDLLTSALGGCKSITLRMYADRKSIRLAPIVVRVLHSRLPAAEVEEAQAANLSGLINLFEVELTLRAPEGEEPLSTQTAEALAGIATRCPVHVTLAGNPQTIIRSKLV